MRLEIRNRITIEETYRVNRCQSMMNVEREEGLSFSRDFDLTIEDKVWNIGAIVGPSGTGKSSAGRSLWGPEALWEPHWTDKAIVDDIAPEADRAVVQELLGWLELGDVATWLRPFRTLSNGEQFRASMARLVAERPHHAVVDEFTSTIHRKLARDVSETLAWLWPMMDMQVVVLSCHHDVLEWLHPDWILETSSGQFAWAKHLADLPEFGRLPVIGNVVGELVA